MLIRVAAGVDFILELQENQVSRLMRTEAGDLDVVMKQVRVFRNGVIFAGEELFLVIETRTPGQIAADLEILALAVAVHVCGADTFGRLGIVGATRGVNMVIPRPPTEL